MPVILVIVSLLGGLLPADQPTPKYHYEQSEYGAVPIAVEHVQPSPPQNAPLAPWLVGKRNG